MVNRDSATAAAGFAKRLRSALDVKGHKQSATILEREFNLRWLGEPVSMHAVRKWLVGQSVPTSDKLTVLARWLDVSEDWLRWGVGEAGAVAADELSLHHAAGTSPRIEETSLLQDYRLLPLADRRAVRAVIDALLRERKHRPDS